MKLKLAILLIIISMVYGESFQYKRILSCVQPAPTHCLKWNQTTVLIYRTLWTYCFSQNTSVQTPTGAKSMRDLQIGDEIFAYDKDKGPTYSKIVAWMHHSPNVTAKFDIIKTNQNNSFQASDYHNVGFINHQHYDFKFAKDLSEGDQLITFPQSNTPTLVQNQIQQERHGLYSPLTEVANFYIYSNEYDGQSKDSSQMILVHSLSQVSQPVSQQWKLDAALMTGRIQTIQPQQDLLYINPFLINWRTVFGDHWHHNLQEVTYEVPVDKSFTPEHNRYTSSSCNNYDPYNYNYMTSSSSCEKQRQDKMQAMGLSVSIVEEMPLLM